MKMSHIKFKAEAEGKKVVFLSSDEPIREGDFLNWLDCRVDDESSSWTTIDKGSSLIGYTPKELSDRNPVARII